MEVRLSNQLPVYPSFVPGIRRAPDRGYSLTPAQTETALKNALRYIPEELHEVLAPEFMEELMTRGRIYGYRYRPEGDLKAKPVDQYKGQCLEGKAFQVMIDNNLSFDIALYPYELVTYGETGQVCQNWMQYRLIKQYLEILTSEQTLVIESGHPLGLFRSKPDAPRVIITNSMMVGLFDNQKDWHIAAQMGVANYGQMTAGGWMYIGPQGIVHGTFNTLLNAGRKKLGIPQDQDLRGHLFVSSGLGGMSGAQPKAAVIAGAASIIAEVDSSRIQTRHSQGWVQHVTEDKAEAFRMAQEAMQVREPISIAYHGNIVDLLEFAEAQAIRIDLLSDQTSCHAVYEGGYCPVGISFAERTELLSHDMDRFCSLVDQSLHRHFEVIKKLVACGTYFFDYGNSFMKAIYDAGVKEISRNGIDEKDGFIWPSYVEDIMGPELFDYGYGPFRWVCLSGKHEDLVKTDQAAMDCIDPNRRGQDRDNYNWIRDAETNRLVVGTEARILYQDAEGRLNIALRFNRMVRDGEVGPIMLGRDQTSCHAVYEGGYCPVGISFAERTELLSHDMDRFCSLVDQSLHRHFEVIKKLVACGTYFFDYGNSFMKAIYDAGVKEISRNGIDEKDGFIWPSYVEDIMGPELFDYGYGPFRWVCLSGKHEDLVKTDQAAMDCIDPNRRGQDRDNYNWIRDAETNRLVVGTEARILYQDAEGRLNIALRFNRMVRDGEVGPIMLGRDHHDVSGTDSPFRETSNIYDGSNVMADMAVQCFAGNAARGMSLVALHNGGGVGIGKAVNGGFGMVLDGSERVDEILRSAMLWDVMGGVARRSWARNPNAMSTSAAFNENYGDWYHITLPFIPKEDLIQNSIRTSLKRKV